MSDAWSRIDLVRGDIVEQDTDAIVNAANSRLLAGGGVDGAIHRAAGPDLQRECARLGGCATGSARITKGYRLRAKHVIHAVGPVFTNKPEDALRLASAYRESLKLAVRNGIHTIALPALSTGAYGYPMAEAATIALRTVHEELLEAPTIELARFVLFDDEALEAFRTARSHLLAAAK
jgi:O-acetyl-ADP-ribose deacetylase (regulator of RNase III)